MSVRRPVRRGWLWVSAAAALCVAPGARAFEVEPVGRLHGDYAAHDADVRPLDDDVLLRRARIGVQGEFNDRWSFEAEYDFVGHGAFKTVALEYEGWKQGAFTIGQIKVPFGLEELTSSNNLVFIERALPGDSLSLSRRLGFAFDRNRDHYTVALMGFGPSIDGHEGNGAGARFTLAPVISDHAVLHVGVAAVTERARGDVKFNARPESRVTDVKFVNTGDLDDARQIHRLGLEAAWRNGPVSVQAEWMHAEIERNAGLAEVDVDGWYVAGSWFLTGESRPYRNGTFRSLKEYHRGGAWELAARYSRLDLDDGTVRGGTESNWTLGVNYHAGKHLRIMANYVDVRSRRRGVADDPRILLLRAQLAF